MNLKETFSNFDLFIVHFHLTDENRIFKAKKIYSDYELECSFINLFN